MGNSVNLRIRREGGGRGTHHFTLPRQEDEVAAPKLEQQAPPTNDSVQDPLDGHPKWQCLREKCRLFCENEWPKTRGER